MGGVVGLRLKSEDWAPLRYPNREKRAGATEQVL